MKLAMFIVFEILRGCFFNILSFLQKKNKFWTFWELLRKNTIRDAFYKRFAKVSAFWKIKFCLQKKNIIFPKKFKFWTFWDCISKKNWKSILKESIHVQCFWKISSGFRENHLFFQKNQNINVLRTPEQYTKSRHNLKKLAKLSVSKSFQIFFEELYLFVQKKPFPKASRVLGL